MSEFDKIWLNVIKNENQIFKTVSGLEFIYKLKNNSIMVFRDGKYVGRLLTKNNFEKAFQLGSYSGYKFSNAIIGSSYVRAILTDNRIKK